MARPLVIGYHLVWTAYGWWLPNDPRGSTSKELCCDILAQLGELHYGRKKIQPAGYVIREFYQQAADLLQFPLLTFDETARDEIAAAFGTVIGDLRYTCWACAVMPDHVHLLIRKHKHQAEEMIACLKDASRERLRRVNLRQPDHPVWGMGHGWKVFLDHPDDIRRTIVYIEKNPLPLRLPRQSWPFVKEYDGWPLHPGHDPDSPYARALRAAARAAHSS
jgi:REP element-mobilizing transposase RayT